MGVKLPQQERIFRDEQLRWAKRSKKIVLDETKLNLRGKVLKRVTGRLLRTLKSRLVKTGATTDGFSIDIGTRYGPGWEKGFRTPERIISPTKGIALRFRGIDGSMIFRRGEVRIPARLYPARSFIGKAIKDKKLRIEVEYKEMFERVFKKSFPDLTITIDLGFG